MAAPGELDTLIYTALHDTGGHSVEGAFVDHWVSNASVALEAMESDFIASGFSSSKAAQIRLAMADASVESSVKLLSWLKEWTRPLVADLLADSSVHLREIGVRAAGELLPIDEWSAAFEDPEPRIRIAAIESLRRALGHDVDSIARRMLADSDGSVRSTAARGIRFLSDSEGADRLVKLWRTDPDPGVRDAILDYVSEITASYTGDKSVEERAGTGIRDLLIAGLDHSDARRRERAAAGLRRFGGKKVAEAVYARLLVESDRDARHALIKCGGFAEIGERGFEILAQILADPDGAARFEAAYQIGAFGEKAVDPLIAALEEPEGPARAAAITLGNLGDLRALPALVKVYGEPADWRDERVYESAIRSIVVESGGHRDAVRPEAGLTAEQSAVIQRLIHGLGPQSQLAWIARYCREELNALPVYSALLYVWAVRPDGSILQIDYEPFRLPDSPEEDPLARFAVMVHGARLHPELREMIPPPPVGTEICSGCRGRGWYEENETPIDCMHCRALGWRIQRRPG